MKSLLQLIVRFLRAEEGPTAIEYALLVSLILLACFSAIILLGQSTGGSFDRSEGKIQSATLP
jgi:pilus assembly protein Flp/PilA